MDLQGLIFDLDGTITDTLPLCVRIYQMVFTEFAGVTLNTEQVVSMFGPNEEGVIRQVIPEHWEVPLERYIQLYEKHHDGGADVLPGVCELLDRLRKCGMNMALVTGKGPETTKITLEKLNLASYFPMVKTGSAGGSIKPRCIAEILREWQLPPSHVAYVGDAPSDVLDARQAGVYPITAGWGKPQAFYEENLHAALTFDAVGPFADWILKNSAIAQADCV